MKYSSHISEKQLISFIETKLSQFLENNLGAFEIKQIAQSLKEFINSHELSHRKQSATPKIPQRKKNSEKQFREIG
jgi:pantothenate kinase